MVARGKLLPRRIPLFFFYLYLVLAVSACSFGEKEKQVRSVAAPPPAATEKTNPLQTIAAMPTAMDTFRALAPPEGLKFTPLFNEPVEDTNVRIKRIEDAVQTLRNDIDTLVPTMVRMVAIEKDIKGLVSQLQTLTGEAPEAEAAPVTDVTPQELPPALPADGTSIPGEEAAKGTDSGLVATKPVSDAASSLVTPEAVPEGELPPEGTASPSSTTPAAVTPPAMSPSAPAAPAALAPPIPLIPQADPVPQQHTGREAPAANAADMHTGREAPADLTEPPPQIVPAAPPALEKKADAEPAAAPEGPTVGDVSNIRIADHADRTRVVLDMTAPYDGAVRIDDNGKTLIIDLSKMKWLGKKSWDADSAQLISGYRIEGGNLLVDLMYAAQIKSQNVLPPAGGSGNHRLVIDLFAEEIHTP